MRAEVALIVKSATDVARNDFRHTVLIVNARPIDANGKSKEERESVKGRKTMTFSYKKRHGRLGL